jgi:hypothetical protein
LDRAETWWCAAGWVCPCGSLVSSKIAISEVEVKRVFAMAGRRLLGPTQALRVQGCAPYLFLSNSSACLRISAILSS